MAKVWTASIEATFKFVGLNGVDHRQIDNASLRQAAASARAFTVVERNQVVAALKKLYEGSDTAAKIIDTAVALTQVLNTNNNTVTSSASKLFYFFTT
jgi:hypothetical protein